MNALALRFEQPEAKNRWDMPLFEIKLEDDTYNASFKDIADALFNKKPPPPNKSTLNVS